MIHVKEVLLEEIIYIRHSVLRPHQSLEECVFETDHAVETFHVGVFVDDLLVTIASFVDESNSDLPQMIQYRLRAMATLPEFRNLGTGRMAVEFGEYKLKQQGIELLWCNGRTNVKAYYEKLGFISFGEVFDYPPIGPHIVMYKTFERL